MEQDRDHAEETPEERRERFAQAMAEADEPQHIFEEVYRSAKRDTASIPWADMKPNPLMVDWLDRKGFEGFDLAKRPEAVVVGCGLGDDAFELAHRGAKTKGFDISGSAIEWAFERLLAMEKRPAAIGFEILDLFGLPDEWTGEFDIAVEIYTFQALPPEYRPRVAESIRSLLREGGELLMIARAFPEGSDEAKLKGPPWSVSLAELKKHFVEAGHFELIGEAEIVADPDEPDVSRLVAHLKAV